jgi:hypothetical protein
MAKKITCNILLLLLDAAKRLSGTMSFKNDNGPCSLVDSAADIFRYYMLVAFFHLTCHSSINKITGFY